MSGLAIAMVVASFTFTSNLRGLVHSPSRYGWAWDLKAGDGFFTFDTKTVMAKLRADPDVKEVAGANYGLVQISGESVPAVGVENIQGAVFPTLLEGRAGPLAMTRSSSARAPCDASTGRSGTRFECRSMARPRRMRISRPSRLSQAGRRGASSRPTSAMAPQCAAKYFADAESPGQPFSGRTHSPPARSRCRSQQLLASSCSL